ncbi:Alcohol dehydrogenase [uncultured Woeseiaceae bacterium]|uniref:Alcohol dehydrogenase n=1 Tax=uncultured Woeseiaceae bacterium TaxID=1983305 RepID=A0A7D9D2V4_9GAMM|nr:Alcohol dehydrogenase [uncultured Woeseiaceae bacterium]
MTTSNMKAAVIHEPGAPEVLAIEELPVPQPAPGWVLIRVKAFGLNRSELFTRQGHSPGVTFPRVLGIEAVGVVEQAPGGEFKPGQIVATAMGGMGRTYDGGYAEYTSVPAAQVQTINTSLDWATLGALPEMIQTAWGSLTRSLQLQAGQSLLIRGGTTSVGLAAAVLAKKQGVTVAATTRKTDRESMLKDNGADHVFIDNGEIAGDVRQVFPGGVDKVLELVGTTTLLDSLRSTARFGSVCMTGMVGNAWELDQFSPMGAIPSTVNLTTYSGGSQDFIDTPLQTVVNEIAAGRMTPRIGRVFRLDDIVAAHRCMEDNAAGGKIVVLT